MENTAVIDNARKFLISYIKENVKASKNEWCNKDNWWIAVKHTFRVERYVTEILNDYKELSESERLTLQIAAILHDIGKVVQSQEHASISAQIVKNIFGKNPTLINSGIDLSHLVEIIEKHSDKKDQNDSDILSLILKDADILDEVGSMSVLMQCSKHQFYTPDYYENVIASIIQKEIPFCEKQCSLLKTPAAKRIMHKKIEFINNFAEQLKYEILGQTENEKLITECTTIEAVS